MDNSLNTMPSSALVNNHVELLAEYLELEKYGIKWNEGERSIPQIWAIYPPRKFVHFALLSLYEFAATNFTKGKVVLDFGCGVGYGSYRLGVRDAKSVHGIELDKKAIEFGNVHFHHPNVTTECKNINDLAADPRKRGTYDFVYCSNVMEHIKDYSEVLKSISELLKPGGQYLQVTPPSGKARGNPFHVTNYTVEEWREVLEPLFPSQRYFSHAPTRPRDKVISEYEFRFVECSPTDMSHLKSISGIILASKPHKFT